MNYVIKIKGMHCAACVNRVQKAVLSAGGIKAASVSLIMNTAAFEADYVDFRRVDQLLQQDGYRIDAQTIYFRGTGVAAEISNAFVRLDGVVGSEFNEGTGFGSIRYVEGVADRKKLVEKLQSMNLKEAVGESAPVGTALTYVIVLLSAVGVSLGMLHMHETFPVQFAIATIVYFVGGWKFHVPGLRTLARLAPNMDALVFLGTTAAYGWSSYAFLAGGHEIYFESGTAIIGAVLLGRTLEAKIRGKMQNGLLALISKTATKARVMREGTEIEVNASELRKGDRVAVRQGEFVPADGVIIDGSAEIDESAIRGDIVPVTKSARMQAFAGTRVINGFLKLEVSCNAADFVLNKITAQLQQSLTKKLGVERFADKVAEYFVFGVIAIAVATFAWWYSNAGISAAFVRAVAVLIISCPCAFGLATPAAVFAASLACTRKGILLRNPAAIESAPAITTVVFDKTGTLTEGRFQVVDVSGDRENTLALAALAELGSNHPIARAISDACTKKLSLVVLSNVTQMPGLGIKAETSKGVILVGNKHLMEFNDIKVEGEETATTVYVAQNGKHIGTIILEDSLKPDAKSAVAAVGRKVALVTGDTKPAAEKAAHELGIEDVHAEVLPHEKGMIIQEMKEKGESVAFVGDGLNDSAAIAAADCGIAMASGSDITVETADVVITSSNPRTVADFFEIAAAARKTIIRNFAWALLYNVILIPLAMGVFGAGATISPALAGVAMACSSLLVMTNSILLWITR